MLAVIGVLIAVSAGATTSGAVSNYPEGPCYETASRNFAFVGSNWVQGAVDHRNTVRPWLLDWGSFADRHATPALNTAESFSNGAILWLLPNEGNYATCDPNVASPGGAWPGTPQQPRIVLDVDIAISTNALIQIASHEMGHAFGMAHVGDYVAASGDLQQQIMCTQCLVGLNITKAQGDASYATKISDAGLSYPSVTANPGFESWFGSTKYWGVTGGSLVASSDAYQGNRAVQFLPGVATNFVGQTTVMDSPSTSGNFYRAWIATKNTQSGTVGHVTMQLWEERIHYHVSLPGWDAFPQLNGSENHWNFPASVTTPILKQQMGVVPPLSGYATAASQYVPYYADAARVSIRIYSSVQNAWSLVAVKLDNVELHTVQG